jgi:hypothetical protein
MRNGVILGAMWGGALLLVAAVGLGLGYALGSWTRSGETVLRLSETRNRFQEPSEEPLSAEETHRRYEWLVEQCEDLREIATEWRRIWPGKETTPPKESDEPAE